MFYFSWTKSLFIYISRLSRNKIFNIHKKTHQNQILVHTWFSPNARLKCSAQTESCCWTVLLYQPEYSQTITPEHFSGLFRLFDENYLKWIKFLHGLIFARREFKDFMWINFHKSRVLKIFVWIKFRELGLFYLILRLYKL